jgi:hypothetical protein
VAIQNKYKPQAVSHATKHETASMYCTHLLKQVRQHGRDGHGQGVHHNAPLTSQRRVQDHGLKCNQ